MKQKTIWDYRKVEVGQEALEITNEITLESVSKYADVCRNANPIYYPPVIQIGSNVMPTQIFGLAPKNRNGIAENNGMTIIQSRATPFAKAEGRWFEPMRAGDIVTSKARVLEKYERRGNKFVTVRLEPTNQFGLKIAEIDHTSIFEFTKSQGKPKRSGQLHDEEYTPSALEETSKDALIDTVTFHEIKVGDSAPDFTIYSALKEEVEQSKDESERFPWGKEHGVGGITIMGYIDQLLQRWIPQGSFYGGGRLNFKAIKNFRPGDTVTYRAIVFGKRLSDRNGLVDFKVKGVNQLGQLTGVAEGTLVVPN